MNSSLFIVEIMLKLVKQDYPTLECFHHVFPHNYHSWNHYVGWIMALCFGLGLLRSLLNILFSWAVKVCIEVS